MSDVTEYLTDIGIVIVQDMVMFGMLGAMAEPR